MNAVILHLGIIATATIFTSPALAHDNRIEMTVADGKRCFVGNGLPDHATGTFPNSGNPNAIEKQNISVCVTANPKRLSNPARIEGSIGIGINGIAFRPGTADWYDASSPRTFSRDVSSGWKVEGLNPDNILGMDAQNAHVGPDGLYHYHGVANALVKSAGKGPIGYAADGFEIRYGGSETPSYQLKSGARPASRNGPGGTYDGTYEQDFAYVAGSGSLDQCNGRMVGGTYVYFATESYPFLPRCVWGDVSADFGRSGGGGEREVTNNRRPRTDRVERGNGNGPPLAATQACATKANDAACSFMGRGNRNVRGTCLTVPSGEKACVPARRG